MQEFGYCQNCNIKLPIISNQNDKPKKAGNGFIDFIALLSLAFSAFAVIASIKFYVIPFFWLIVYGLWYIIAKANGKDVSGLKNSFYAIFIAFFIGFGIIIIR